VDVCPPCARLISLSPEHMAAAPAPRTPAATSHLATAALVAAGLTLAGAGAAMTCLPGLASHRAQVAIVEEVSARG
jgi:hypothetical protein